MKLLIVVLLFAGITATARPMVPRELVDVDGQNHALYDSKSKATVLIAFGASCPMLRKMVPLIEDLAIKYRPKGVRFFYVASTLQDTPAELLKERNEYKLTIPLLLDKDQNVLADTGMQATTETVLIDSTTRERKYRGAITDRFTYEVQKSGRSTDHLSVALDEFLAGREVKTKQTNALGCKITTKKSLR